MCHTPLAAHIVLIHTSLSTHNTHLTMYTCTHVYINWYMYIYFTNIHMYRSTIGMCIYTQRERIIIKWLTYTLWTYLLPNSYSYPLQPAHTVQCTYTLTDTQTATTLVHTDRHRQTVTINSGAYTPHTVTDNTVTLYSIHSFNDTHYSQDNNNRTYW